MQVIAAAPLAPRGARVALARTGFTGSLLLVVGGLLAWAFLATPILSSLTPNGRPTDMEMVVGIAAWGFAIVVPAGFVILGVAMLIGAVEGFSSFRPRTATPRLTRALGPEHLAATNLLLPSGRRIHELVLGPFGIVVLGDVPPTNVSRYTAGRWEIKGHGGHWVPMEPPLDRAERDAERVRGWLASDDRDFVVKVYAAVVTDDERVARTPQCAVVRSDELASWLAGLPPQRGITEERRVRLAERIRGVAQPS